MRDVETRVALTRALVDSIFVWIAWTERRFDEERRCDYECGLCCPAKVR
jgi:hypothetical protein